MLCGKSKELCEKNANLEKEKNYVTPDSKVYMQLVSHLLLLLMLENFLNVWQNLKTAVCVQAAGHKIILTK